jgi:hypothetical protein
VTWIARAFIGNDLWTIFSRASARSDKGNVCSLFLGNRQLNSASYYVTGFLRIRAVTIAMQQLSKQTLNNGATVFCGIRAEGLSWRSSALQSSSR